MTAFKDILVDQRPRSAAKERPPHVRSRRSSVPSVALLAALGVLVVAAAFTAGRRGAADSSLAHAVYWVGQLLIIVPVAVRVLGNRPRPRSEIVGLLLVLSIAQYLVKICYSPLAFTHPDELQHWRTATNILDLGRLFTDNHALPVSPHYPGLENTTAAVVSVSDLSTFVGGLVVIGVAHLVFVVLLFSLFERVAGSTRIGGIAVLVYASNPHFAAFDSLFVYGAMALPFLAAALLIARRLADGDVPGLRAGWIVLGFVAVAVTVVTHHVSSYALVLLFTLVAAATTVLQPRAAVWPAAFAAVSALFTAGWLVLVAPETLHYLEPVTTGLLQSLSGTPSVDPGSVTLDRPFADATAGVVATAAMTVLLPFGWLEVWRTRRHDGWAVGFAVASVSWYALVVLRVLASDSAEVVGRASTYVYLPVAYVAALAIVRLAAAPARRPPAPVVATTIVIGLLLSGLANGWPPYWERLPGAYEPGGFERSVSPQGVQAARWVAGALGPANRFGADLANYSLLGSYGDSNAVRNAAPLFRSDRLRPSDAALIRAQDLRFIMTDERLTRRLPPSGRYFPVDFHSGDYKQPLSPEALAKFGRLPGVSRVYDSGDIKIYDLWGAGYAR